MRFTLRVSAVAAAFLSLAASAGNAQTGQITASANVLPSITVTGAQNLDFGNVTPGVASTVAVTAATAGRFDLLGQAAAPVNLTFSLPTTLASGLNTLPIGTWTGRVNTSNVPTGGTSFTPSASAQAATFSGAGELWVFLGGTVTPASNQTPGLYTGTVTLTAVYQ
jgi:spore coat protein U-like protein